MTFDKQFAQRLEHPEFYEYNPGSARRLLAFVSSLAQAKLRYIDRSRHNAEDDFAELAEGSDVVAYSHKLTQGTSYAQSYINLGVERLKKAFDAGLLIQGYHFHADQPGKDEMEFFLEAFEPVEQYTEGVYLPSMIDVETNFGITRNLRQARVGNWLWWVNTEQGKLPMWYSSQYLFGQLLGSDTPWRNSYRKHIASWTTASQPSLPTGVDSDKLFGWQYGVCGQHYWAECPAGVVGATDVNYLMISLEEAKKMAGAGLGKDPIPTELVARVAALEAWRQEAENRLDALSQLRGHQNRAISELGTNVAALQSKNLSLESRISEAEGKFEAIGDILE